MKNAADCATFMPMKKTIASVLFLLLAHALAASEIKGLIGINWSKYLFSADATDLELRNKIGSRIGLGWALDLNLHLQVEIDALISKRGAKTELTYAPGQSISGIYTHTAISVPILFKFKLKRGASPYAALGPEFAFILSHRLQLPDSQESFDLSDNTKKFMLGFEALLGYQLPAGSWRIIAELRYGRWFSNLMKLPEPQAKSESFSFLLGGVYVL